METKNNIESLALELAGIKDTLYLLSAQFGNNVRCAFDPFTVSGELNAIAMHIDRIGNDLDAIAAQK